MGRINLNIECKDCGAEMKAPDDAVVGEIVTCPDCGRRRLGPVDGRYLHNL